MSPEAIQKGRFSESSDVWAFAVTMWEILSLGNIPYFDINNDRELIDYVCAGGRLARDQMTCECPDALWSLMQCCLAKAAKDRPRFSGLVVELEALREEMAKRKLAEDMAQAKYVIPARPLEVGTFFRQRCLHSNRPASKFSARALLRFEA